MHGFYIVLATAIVQINNNLKKNKMEQEKYNYYKSNFLTYFDGCYDMQPEPDTPSTYTMGLCKLEYKEKENTLIAHVRRPGILIGKGGKTINDLHKHLGCKVGIKEINF